MQSSLDNVIHPQEAVFESSQNWRSPTCVIARSVTSKKARKVETVLPTESKRLKVASMDYASTEETQTCVREGSLNKSRTQQGFQVKWLKHEVERKELRILKPHVFTFIFESYHVWLLTLTTPVITKIFLPQFDSWSSLRNSLEKSNAAGNVRLYDIQVSQIGLRFF